MKNFKSCVKKHSIYICFIFQKERLCIRCNAYTTSDINILFILISANSSERFKNKIRNYNTKSKNVFSIKTSLLLLSLMKINNNLNNMDLGLVFDLKRLNSNRITLKMDYNQLYLFYFLDFFQHTHQTVASCV